jgi:hypothetical protein
MGCANERDDDDEDDDDRDRQSDFDYDYQDNSSTTSGTVPKLDKATKEALLGDSGEEADFDVSSSEMAPLLSRLSNILNGLGNGSLPGAGNGTVVAILRELIGDAKSGDPYKVAQAILAFLLLDGCVRGFKAALKAQKSQKKIKIITVAICFLKALLMKKAPGILAILKQIASSPESLKAFLQTALKPK